MGLQYSSFDFFLYYRYIDAIIQWQWCTCAQNWYCLANGSQVKIQKPNRFWEQKVWFWGWVQILMYIYSVTTCQVAVQLDFFKEKYMCHCVTLKSDNYERSDLETKSSSSEDQSSSYRPDINFHWGSCDDLCNPKPTGYAVLHCCLKPHS